MLAPTSAFQISAWCEAITTYALKYPRLCEQVGKAYELPFALPHLLYRSYLVKQAQLFQIASVSLHHGPSGDKDHRIHIKARSSVEASTSQRRQSHKDRIHEPHHRDTYRD